MMKSNVTLLVIAGVLAIPTGIQLYSDAESFVDYSRIPLMFDGLTTENVGVIQIAVPKDEQPAPNPQKPDQKVPVAYDQLMLQRGEKGWVVSQTPQAPNKLAGAPVNGTRVERDVFDHLLKIRVDQRTIIQANATPEQLAEYGLDEKSATLIRCRDKTNQNDVAALYVGADAAGKLTGTEGVRGVFVRRHDSNDVVLYEFDKGWLRDIATDQWVDRVLLKVAPEAVTRLSITNQSTGGKPVVLEREPGKSAWTCPAPPADRGAVRQAEIEGILARLRYIAITEFRRPLQQAGNLAVMGLQPPQIQFEITFKDGDTDRTATFTVGNRLDGDANTHYLTSSEAPFLMTWPAAMATALQLDIPNAWFDPAGAPTNVPAAGNGGGDGKNGGDNGK